MQYQHFSFDTQPRNKMNQEIQEIQEMCSAYRRQKTDRQYVIGEMIKLYVNSCIEIPKELSVDEYDIPLPDDKVRVRDHTRMDSDLYHLISFITETMQENHLDKDVIKDMFQSQLDLIETDEDEDDFESELL